MPAMTVVEKLSVTLLLESRLQCWIPQGIHYSPIFSLIAGALTHLTRTTQTDLTPRTTPSSIPSLVTAIIKRSQLRC